MKSILILKIAQLKTTVMFSNYISWYSENLRKKYKIFNEKF